MVTARSHYICSFELYFGSKNDVDNTVKAILPRFLTKLTLHALDNPVIVVDNYYVTFDSITAVHECGWGLVGTI